MLSEDSSPSDQEVQQVIRDAKRVLVDAQAKREAAGLGGPDAREKLESLLSHEDIAEVHAAVQAKLMQLKRDALTSEQSAETSPPKARHPRPMI